MWRFIVFESALFEQRGGGVVELSLESRRLALQCPELPALGKNLVTEGLDRRLDMGEKFFERDDALVKRRQGIGRIWIVHRFYKINNGRIRCVPAGA